MALHKDYILHDIVIAPPIIFKLFVIFKLVMIALVSIILIPILFFGNIHLSGNIVLLIPIAIIFIIFHFYKRETDIKYTLKADHIEYIDHKNNLTSINYNKIIDVRAQEPILRHLSMANLVISYEDAEYKRELLLRFLDHPKYYYDIISERSHQLRSD